MANNRMWLVCGHCGRTTLLGKYYPTLTNGWFIPTPGGFVVQGDGEITGEQSQEWGDHKKIEALDAWLQKHTHQEHEITMDGPEWFRIEYGCGPPDWEAREADRSEKRA